MSVGNDGRVVQLEPAGFFFSPFKELTTVTVALAFYPWAELAQDGRHVVEFALVFFPAIRHLHVVVETETRKMRLEELFAGGFGGEDEEFFRVNLGKFPRFGIDDEER